MEVTKEFIASVYDLVYPEGVLDWVEGETTLEGVETAREEIGELGVLLKKFTLAVDAAKQVRHARVLQQRLGTYNGEAKLETFLRTYRRLLEARRERVRASQRGWWWDRIGAVPNVSVDNDGVWGSKRQYMYGWVTSRFLEASGITLEPFLCMALNPTGGICGAGNGSLYRGSVESALIVHSCVHDASGYLYRYHGLGRGYNYLGTWFALPSGWAMSCQVMGIYRCWRESGGT